MLGAIGSMLSKPVFSLAKSTCKESVVQFLLKLNGVVNPDPSVPRKKVTIVLDNHLAHKTEDVTTLAHQLDFELLFQPPYTPEINSIESLWSIVKRDLKRTLLKHRDTELTPGSFKLLILAALSRVTRE